jgi:hypothetical protein
VQVSHISGLRPGIADPVFSLNVTNEIQKAPGRNKIMNKVPARSEPRGRFPRDVGNPLGRRVCGRLRRFGIGVIPWSPLAGGLLTGRYRQADPYPEGSRMTRSVGPRWRPPSDEPNPIHDRQLEVVEELIGVAAAAGIEMTHMAHAFVLEHPAVTSAVIGPRTMAQLDDALAGADVRLDEATLDAIDEIVPPTTEISGPEPFAILALEKHNRRRPR